MFLQLRSYRFQTLDPCKLISSLNSFFEGLWFQIKNLFLRSYLGWLYLGNGCTNFEFSGGIKYIIIFLKSDLVYLFFAPIKFITFILFSRWKFFSFFSFKYTFNNKGISYLLQYDLADIHKVYNMHEVYNIYLDQIIVVRSYFLTIRKSS